MKANANILIIFTVALLKAAIISTSPSFQKQDISSNIRSANVNSSEIVIGSISGTSLNLHCEWLGF